MVKIAYLCGMKKLILTLVMLAMAVCGYAQASLKGTWEQSQSMMGMSASETITYQDEKTGKVCDKAKMTINVGMMSARVKGEANCYLEGTFKYVGDKITIKWNPDSFKFDMTKPLTVTIKNEESLPKEKKAELEKKKKEMAKEFEEIITSLKEDMMKKLSEEEVLTDVKVSDKKLTYKYIEDGKTQTDKYTRVK